MMTAGMAETAKGMGGLDTIVNNASMFTALTPKPFFQVDDAEYDLIMRVNARGLLQVMCAIMPTRFAAGDGKVVNIASGTSYNGLLGLSHYTTSKAAVIILTRCHGSELGDKNSQINAIALVLTESEGMAANTGFDMARAPSAASPSIKRDMLPEDLLGRVL